MEKEMGPPASKPHNDHQFRAEPTTSGADRASANRYTPAERAFSRRKVHANITGQTGRILQAIGYPGRRLRDLVDAIQSAHGAGNDAKMPYTPFARSHLTIAEYMDLRGKPDSKRSVVSRALDAHKKWQRQTGYTLIDVISPTDDNDIETTTYIDHLTPIADESFQRAMASPLWSQGRNGIAQALAESVAWAIEQLPKDAPEKDSEPETMALADYVYQQERRLLQSIESVREHISRDYGEDEAAERFIRKLASRLARTADSDRKTRPARLGTVESHSGGAEPACDSITTHAISEGGHAEQSIPPLSNPSETSNLIFASRLEPELPPEEIRALNAFRGVGCDHFEWLYLDDGIGQEGQYHHTEAAELASDIGEIVEGGRQAGQSVIVRARGPVLQLDDCDAEAALLLEPFSFVVIETSPNNFQCWLAFKDDWDKAESRGRLFARLKDLAPGVNPGAGGAVRWPGSINCKPERNGWRVRLDSVNTGRVVTPSELEDVGLLADPPPATEWNWLPNGAPGEWPDYPRCVEAKTVEGVCDRSRADAQFVFFALKRYRSPKEIAAKLAEVSPRAKESGERYINRTVAAGVEYLGMGAQ